MEAAQSCHNRQPSSGDHRIHHSPASSSNHHLQRSIASGNSNFYSDATRKTSRGSFYLTFAGAFVVLAVLLMLRKPNPPVPAVPPSRSLNPEREKLCAANHALASLPAPWTTGVFMTLAETLGINPDVPPFVTSEANGFSWPGRSEEQRTAILEAWVSTVEQASTRVDVHSMSGEKGEHHRRLMSVLALVTLTLQDNAARAEYFEVVLPAINNAGGKAVGGRGNKSRGEREREMRRVMRDEMARMCHQGGEWH